MLEFYPSIQTAVSQEAVNQGLPPGPSMPFRSTGNNNVGEPSVTVKTEASLLEAICANCGRVILDRYVMRVADRNYHEDCLSCAACSAPLSHSCFIREHKLYCRADYERIFGAKCARCMEKINCSELVMRVVGLVFHIECFTCFICGEALVRGTQIVIRQGRPICRRDFENEFLHSPQVAANLSGGIDRIFSVMTSVGSEVSQYSRDIR